MLLPYSSITQHVRDFLSTFLLSFQDSLAISDYQKFWCKLVYMEHNHINASRCLVKRYKWAQEYARLLLSWKDGQELWACMVSKREFTKSNWSGKQSHMYREEGPREPAMTPTFQSIFCYNIYIYIYIYLPPFTFNIHIYIYTHTNTIWCINVSFYLFLISTNTILQYIYIYTHNHHFIFLGHKVMMN